MQLSRDALMLVLALLALAAGGFAVALWRRSWALWLLAFAVTLGALGVAYVNQPRGSAATGVSR